MARILITGSRDWACPELALATLSRLVERYGRDLVIVHGDCPTGVDAAFDRAAGAKGLTVEAHPADWDRHGKAAGPRRNEAMVKLGADLCIALSKDIKASKGTAGCARLAIAAGIPTCLVADDSGEPKWITEV